LVVVIVSVVVSRKRMDHKKTFFSEARQSYARAYVVFFVPV
jgi:hypothetical protein